MRFLNVVKIVVTLSAGFALLGCNSQTIKVEKTYNHSRPNVIYILADDLGYGEIGAYGQTKIKTPNLDKLALQGFKFTQHYSGSTVCAPTRSTILEGKHTGYTTVRGNWTGGKGRDQGNYPLPADSRTLAHMFQEQGYTTGIFGKWG